MIERNNLINNSFLRAISKSFRAYNVSGSRSNKKLIPIHKWFALIIKHSLGKSYSVRSLGEGGEVVLSGKYYPKTLDISVLKDKKVVATLSFKFVTSNYKQNTNNYFEGLLGETANIRRMNIGFAHFIVLRSKTPYYDKNKGNLRGEEKRIEVLNERDLSKYVKLFKDNDFPHKPDLLGIEILDFNLKGIPHFEKLSDLDLSEDTKNVLEKHLSLTEFLEKFIALCKLKS